ncbi:hypothetical protein AGLY_017824 [Aphis glycines]|uniref:THAP-type domain-containing protein n=1 Tax=Aphis glycines TaxID=307491 RepID=A0A6G0STT7_APHGL|nr:hypothetical protein AGLY_017824 [Aphis glycines]
MVIEGLDRASVIFGFDGHRIMKTDTPSSLEMKEGDETLPSTENEIIMKQLKMTTSKYISADFRKFALTLHFYSPAAYSFVRDSFNNALPHPSTLRNWYFSIDGSPGFTSESINAIRLKSEEMKNKGKTLLCGLTMDEMYLKEHVHYNGDKLQGYISCGIKDSDFDGLLKAREALVFMLVALNSHWKVPIAYFLINGLSSQEKTNL